MVLMVLKAVVAVVTLVCVGGDGIAVGGVVKLGVGDFR